MHLARSLINQEDNSKNNNKFLSDSNEQTLLYLQHKNNRSETITVTTFTPKHYFDRDLPYSGKNCSRNFDEDNYFSNL